MHASGTTWPLTPAGEPGRNSGVGVLTYALGGGPPLARHPEAWLSQRGAFWMSLNRSGYKHNPHPSAGSQAHMLTLASSPKQLLTGHGPVSTASIWLVTAEVVSQCRTLFSRVTRSPTQRQATQVRPLCPSLCLFLIKSVQHSCFDGLYKPRVQMSLA